MEAETNVAGDDTTHTAPAHLDGDDDKALMFEDDNNLENIDGEEDDEKKDEEKEISDEEAVRLLNEEMANITVCAPVPIP